MFFDNRRQIIEEGLVGFDLSDNLQDSLPLPSVNACKRIRFLSKVISNKPYTKTTTRKSSSVYKTFLEVGVRNFLKGYLSKEKCFGLLGNEFLTVTALISFILGFVPAKGLKISHGSVSNLKHRQIIFRSVPNTKENIAFARYVKDHLPYFDMDSFLTHNQTTKQVNKQTNT